MRTTHRSAHYEYIYVFYTFVIHMEYRLILNTMLILTISMRLLPPFILFLISAVSAMADVNVLVIGSDTDSSSVDYSSIYAAGSGYYEAEAASVSAFDET